MGPFRFDPESYGTAVSGILGEVRLPPLGPGLLSEEARSRLQSFDPQRDLGGPVRDPLAALACYAGLWLYSDGLEQSHAISQDLTTAEGSFWHAIMHRREPDPYNSKYWWRRVGNHPVLEQLREQTPALGYLYTTPQDFVDLCEKVRGLGNAQEDLARKVQLLEWQLLFDWCYRQAVER